MMKQTAALGHDTFPAVVGASPDTAQLSASQARLRHHKSDQREFNLLFALIFSVFLVAAIVSRLRPSKLIAMFDKDSNQPSVMAEAHRAASELTPYLFQ